MFIWPDMKTLHIGRLYTPVDSTHRYGTVFGRLYTSVGNGLQTVPNLVPNLERQPQAKVHGPRGLHRRREARIRTRNRKLFHFGRRIQDVVGIEQDGEALPAN